MGKKNSKWECGISYSGNAITYTEIEAPTERDAVTEYYYRIGEITDSKADSLVVLVRPANKEADWDWERYIITSRSARVVSIQSTKATPAEPVEVITATLKSRMWTLRLTRKELAEKADLSINLINRLLSGDNSVPLSAFLKACQALDVVWVG